MSDYQRRLVAASGRNYVSDEVSPLGRRKGVQVTWLSYDTPGESHYMVTSAPANAVHADRLCDQILWSVAHDARDEDHMRRGER